MRVAIIQTVIPRLCRSRRDIFDVAKNPDIDIVVELIGGTTVARDLVMTALEHGKHVVTANKALIAEHGMEIFAHAEKCNLIVAYEAAVAGVFRLLKVCAKALLATVSTGWPALLMAPPTLFSLKWTAKVVKFADVLTEAQEKGYAEADPTFDVEGIDAAHKLVIMASLAFAIPLGQHAVFTDGITKLDPQDVANAREMGYAVKHLGIARQTTRALNFVFTQPWSRKAALIAGVDDVLKRRDGQCRCCWHHSVLWSGRRRCAYCVVSGS